MCDRQLELCPKLTCDQCHEKEYHMPCYIMPQHIFSDADGGYPNRLEAKSEKGPRNHFRWDVMLEDVTHASLLV